MNKIAKNLNESVTFQVAIEQLYVHKPLDKIIVKAAEELNELAATLLQFVNKEDKAKQRQNVLEEMVDVNMHLQLLEKHFVGIANAGNSQARLMVLRKINKMLNSRDFKQYDPHNTVKQ
jgi:vacuolar-type H+-ATPase subunit I/STV1